MPNPQPSRAPSPGAAPVSTPREVVVVGAGLAGLRTAAALRERGWDGSLTVVGAETHRPYDRPPLSKALLSKALLATASTAGAQPSPTWLEHDLHADLDVLADELLLGRRATALQRTPEGPALTLDGGTRRRPDAVVLACGAQPRVPAGLAGALTLRTLSDAAELRAALRPGNRVVCVGAGWIGAEVATAAARAGCRVTVLEAGPAPLATALGARVGALTVPWYAAAGIELRVGAPVEALLPGGVRLADGATVAADAVVVGVGVHPDVGWLAGSGLDLGPGVRVDAGQRAGHGPSSSGVWAVGDCATRWSTRYGMWSTAEHWDEALRAPDVAVTTLLGGEAGYDEPPYIFSTQLGRELALVGRPGDAARVVLRGDPAAEPGGEGWAAAFVADDGTLRALFAVDRPHDLAQARKALSRAAGPGAPVDAEALADPGVPVRAAVR